MSESAIVESVQNTQSLNVNKKFLIPSADTMVENRTFDPAVFRNSTNAYLNYRKKIQGRLAEINNNVSDMIKESCSGIDRICNRVRECLNQMDSTMDRKSSYYPALGKESELVEETCRTDDDITEITSQVMTDANDLEQNLHTENTTEYEIEEQSKTITDVKEIDEDVDGTDTSIIENLHEEPVSDLKGEISETTLLKPFFTVINFRDRGESGCEIKQDLSFIDPKSKENKAQLDPLGDADDNRYIMNKIVENIHQKIKNLSEATICKQITQEKVTRKTFSSYTKNLSEATICKQVIPEIKVTRKTSSPYTRSKNLLEAKTCKQITREKVTRKTSSSYTKNLSEATICKKIIPEIKVTRKTSSPDTQSKIEKKIKRLSKINSEQKSVQVDDYCSESDMDYILVHDQQSKSFIMPDVYRKRGTTDLNKKLVDQLEANDSFIFFQKLMDRRKKYMKNSEKKAFRCEELLNIPTTDMKYLTKSPSGSGAKVNTSLSLGKKYADSLWFSPAPVIKVSKLGKRNQNKKSKKSESQRSFKVPNNSPRSERLKDRLRKIKITGSELLNKRVPKFGSLRNISEKPCPVERPCKRDVQNEAPISDHDKCRLHWMRARSGPRRKLEFLDILDDLTNRDLLPIRSEYPRKDKEKPLYNNDIAKDRQLANDEQLANDGQTVKEVQSVKDIQDTYLYKLMYGKQATQDTWKHLLEPQVECLKKNCKYCKPGLDQPESSGSVCSVQSSPSAHSLKQYAGEKQKINKAVSQTNNQQLTKREVVKKLSPYLHDPDKKTGCHRVVTVMPVQVYYENYKLGEPTLLKPKNSKTFSSSPKKSQSLFMKEVKGFKKAEWSAAGLSKPMKVVYDILPKKPDVKPILKKTEASPTSPWKPVGNSARQKIPLKKTVSRSFTPKSFDTFCQNEPKNGKKEKSYTEARDKCLAKYSKIQSDIEKIKNEVSGKISNPEERKMWATKYGKSMGQKLINFIENQAPLPKAPMPWYCLPKLKSQSSISMTKMSSASDGKTSPVFDGRTPPVFNGRTPPVLGSRNPPVPGGKTPPGLGGKTPPTNPRIKIIPMTPVRPENKPSTIPENKTITNPSTPRFFIPQNQATNNLPTINNLQGLQQKNALIQNNIQKAINVIENKMMDIIAADSTSVEAFDVMEKEITNVLSMMKCNKRSPIALTRNAENKDAGASTLEEDFNTISDELFKKLQRILDSEKSSENTASDSSAAALHSKTTTQSPTRKKETQKKQSSAVPISTKKDSGKSTDYNTTSGTDTNLKKGLTPRSTPRKEESSRKIQRSINARKAKTDIRTDLSSVTTTSAEESVHIRSYSPSVSTSKRMDKKKLRFEKKSKVSVKLSTEIKPCGDQNSQDKKSVKNLAPQVKKETEEKSKEENSMGDFEKAKRERAAKIEFYKLTETMKAIVGEDSVKEKPENLTPETEETKENPPKEQQDTIANEASASSSPALVTDPSSVLKVTDPHKEGSTSSFSEEVHKIIKRVEDIYTQLDYMQNTDNQTNIPRFKDNTEVPEVSSEIFLTPFMQAVKEKRVNQETPDKAVTQSPSYYNVISFLDTLSNIQEEKAFEIRTARLCYHVNVYHQPQVCHNSSIQHLAEITPDLTEKPSCLKKICEVASKCKQKKVSFLVLKEDKSSQATLCQRHQQNNLKVPSPQFPPKETKSSEQSFDLSGILEGNRYSSDCNTDKTPSGQDATVLCNKAKSESVLTRYNNSVLDNEDNNASLPNQTATMESNYENTKKTDMSKIDNNSTQMLCHAQSEMKNKLETGTDAKEISLINESIQAAEKVSDGIGITTNENICGEIGMPQIETSTQMLSYIQKDAFTDIEFRKGDKEDKITEKTEDNDSENMETESEFLEVNAMGGACGKPIARSTEIDDDQIYNDESGEKITAQTTNSLQSPKKHKIVVFREIREGQNPLKSLNNLNNFNNIKLYKQSLEKRKELRLIRKSSLELVKKRFSETILSDTENVVLLKSFYAIVYILMFTALSLDYRCI